MPAHHGQTYDPDQEPAPRGGWFRMEARPFPARLDRAFRVAAIVVGVGAAGSALWLLKDIGQKGPADTTAWGAAAALTLIAAALAYGFTRAIGLIALAVYGATRDGPELVVDWRALRHDLPLRRTHALLLEAALLIATVGMGLWGLARFVRQGEGFGLAVFVLVNALMAWPSVRRWMQARPV